MMTEHQLIYDVEHEEVRVTFIADDFQNYVDSDLCQWMRLCRVPEKYQNVVNGHTWQLVACYENPKHHANHCVGFLPNWAVPIIEGHIANNDIYSSQNACACWSVRKVGQGADINTGKPYMRVELCLWSEGHGPLADAYIHDLVRNYNIEVPLMPSLFDEIAF